MEEFERSSIWVGRFKTSEDNIIKRTNREPCEKETNRIDGRNTSGMC